MTSSSMSQALSRQSSKFQVGPQAPQSFFARASCLLPTAFFPRSNHDLHKARAQVRAWRWYLTVCMEAESCSLLEELGLVLLRSSFMTLLGGGCLARQIHMIHMRTHVFRKVCSHITAIPSFQSHPTRAVPCNHFDFRLAGCPPSRLFNSRSVVRDKAFTRNVHTRNVQVSCIQNGVPRINRHLGRRLG